jgi:GntR family transcriptional regulator
MADPMYRQIAEDLRRQIEVGELPPGTQLRTELELRERYDASRNTVRDAVKWLITRGLVETRPGQGTFVTAEIVPFVTALTPSLEIGFGGEDGTYVMEVTAKRRIAEARTPRVEIQQADDTGAVELQLASDAMVISRHQQRYIDETPWSLQTSFYPRTLDERGAERLSVAKDIEQGAVTYIEETLGLKLLGWRDKITVRAPDEVETTFFKLPDDGRVAVIETRRTGFDENGTPFVLTVSVFPADRNQFVIDVGEVPPEVVNPAASSQDGANSADVPSPDSATPS